MAGCGGQRGHVEQYQAVSSAGGHEDWGILARELRPSAHSPSLIRLSWCLLAPYINSLPIATLLSVLHVCRDRFEAFGGFRVTDWAAPSGYLVLVAVYVSVDVCRKVGGSRGEHRYIGGLV